ncbi:AraC family transcriptional regulator [Mucilaginibacter sp. dw_454]|uniref:helix-turn-helix transcriptional regulator n=1 Tax=Mucilaginibacter sp. dw_454 TaxID=2720079 RepID=UPI001BD4C5EE|nr:AraC family transcriptional regulator [Mucilaginibacter sp. dw_454]
MRQLKTGEFFGDTDQVLRLDGLILTDTVYTHPYVDWHYHEHAYFTFILQGAVLEGNQKGLVYCSPGTLLYHHHQEPHYNQKPDGFTRGFHIEIEEKWFQRFDLRSMEGSLKIDHTQSKLIFYRLFSELKLNDHDSSLSIDDLLLRILAGDLPKIGWVPRLKEILHEERLLSLDQLSQELGLHPVHISRMSAKYLGCTLGEYLRKIKVEQALALLPDTRLSLTRIAIHCGFADQSHFIRCFKSVVGTTPSVYRKLLIS